MNKVKSILKSKYFIVFVALITIAVLAFNVFLSLRKNEIKNRLETKTSEVYALVGAGQEPASTSFESDPSCIGGCFFYEERFNEDVDVSGLEDLIKDKYTNVLYISKTDSILFNVDVDRFSVSNEDGQLSIVGNSPDGLN